MKQSMHVWMLLFLQFFYMLQLSVIKDSKYIFLLIVQFVLFSSTCCTPVVHNAYIYIYLMLTSTFFILLRFTPWTFYNGWLINKIQWKLKTMNGSRLHCWNFQEVLNVSNSWLFRQHNILINKILFHMNNLKEMLIWTVINALFVAHAGCNGCNHFREEFDMPIHKG